MHKCGKADELVGKIISTFAQGSLPNALAPLFIDRDKHAPCSKWSWGNRLLAAIAGSSDSRTLRQWNAVGRSVNRGEKSHHILAPLTVKSRKQLDEHGNPRVLVIGYRSVPVFSYEQTAGAPLPEKEATECFLESLPLRAVAESWGLSIRAYDGAENRPAGWYARDGKTVALGVQNLSTWAHELIHAADDRAGNLTERGQHWRSEVVAELGGATLLCALNLPNDADVGGAYRYIEAYCKRENISPISACLQVLNRVCNAVELILTTAEELQKTQTLSQKAA